MASSQASVTVGADGSNYSENLNELSITSDQNIRPVSRRNGRWTFRLRRRDPNSNGTQTPFRFKALSVSCSCSSSVKGSCVIAVASFIELIGNLIGLLYGILYIQGAVNFYAIGNDQDMSDPKVARAYEDKLNHVLFLEENRVGLVGLLATCFMGLITAFLMPIGTIFRSWKSLRCAMSLLLAICLAQIFLTIGYLTTSELLASTAAVPFRLYEIFLIGTYIRFCKQKKKEAALRAKGTANINSLQSMSGGSPCASGLVAASTSTLDENNMAPMDAANGNNDTLTLNLNDGKISDPAGGPFSSDPEDGVAVKKKRKRHPFSRYLAQRRAKVKALSGGFDAYRDVDLK